MQYILLLYAQETGYGTLSEAEKSAWWAKINAYNDGLVKSGHYKLTSGLQSPSTAKTLTRQNGKLETVDGPYAETKDIVVGFSIVSAADYAEAVGLAKGNPVFDEGGMIEIRQILKL